MGGGREAIANDAHGVLLVKNQNHEDPVYKKSEKKRSDVELRRESTYDSNGICIRGCMYYGYDMEKLLRQLLLETVSSDNGHYDPTSTTGVIIEALSESIRLER